MKKLACLAIFAYASMSFAANSNNVMPTRVGPPEINPPFVWKVSPRVLLWNNGDTDGSNGYSNGNSPDLGGAVRRLLDDFVVPSGDVWDVDQVDWLHIWTNGGGPKGTGLEISFHADAGGSPNLTPLVTPTVTSYNEVGTGRTWFGRPEMASTALFNAVNFTAGTYWVRLMILGPENNFLMIRATVTGAGAWCDFSDLGTGPCPNVIGGTPPVDLAYSLSGLVVPVELQSFSVE